MPTAIHPALRFDKPLRSFGRRCSASALVPRTTASGRLPFDSAPLIAPCSEQMLAALAAKPDADYRPWRSGHYRMLCEVICAPLRLERRGLVLR